MFSAAGLPEPRADAGVLAEEATGLTRTALLLHGEELLGEAAAAKLAAMAARRLAREPVFRIVGRRPFWGLDLRVTPAVLDPRPDTETVVAASLERVGGRRSNALRVLDLGTGSGAILCALLHECPAALGIGVDRSPDAARIAYTNVEDCGIAGRAAVIVGDWGAAVAGSFDLVVSNPPYIETESLAGLDPEVRDHDPHLALDGGPDGLACYRLIADALPKLLASGGHAVLEIGWRQGAAVQALLNRAGLADVRLHHDYAGLPRVVSGTLSGSARL